MNREKARRLRRRFLQKDGRVLSHVMSAEEVEAHQVQRPTEVPVPATTRETAQRLDLAHLLYDHPHAAQGLNPMQRQVSTHTRPKEGAPWIDRPPMGESY